MATTAIDLTMPCYIERLSTIFLKRIRHDSSEYASLIGFQRYLRYQRVTAGERDQRTVDTSPVPTLYFIGTFDRIAPPSFFPLS